MPTDQLNWQNRVIKGLNSLVRKADFALNRTHGSLIEPLLGIPGYPSLTILPFASILFFLVFSPSLHYRGVEPVLLFSGALAVGWLGAMFFSRKRTLRVFECCVILGVAGLVLWRAGDDAAEADPKMFRHILIPYFASMAIVLLFLPGCIARRLVRGFVQKFSKKVPTTRFQLLLERAELFVIPSLPQVDNWQLVRNMLRGSVRHLLKLLLITALCVLLARREHIVFQAWLGGAIGVVVLGFGTTYYRFEEFLEGVNRLFLRGGAVVVSLIVILLAALRLAQFDYVSTPLDSTPSTFAIACILAAYTALWFFDAWISYSLCERLLAILDPHFPDALENTRSQVDYPFDPNQANPLLKTKTLKDNRFVQIHGSRFVAVGQYGVTQGVVGECWESYGTVDLFDALVFRANFKKPRARKLEEKFRLRDLRQRVQFYFLFLYLVLGLGVGAVWKCFQLADPVSVLPLSAARVTNPSQVPVEKDEKQAGFAGLTNSLFAEAERESEIAQRPRAVLFAASGGGTRAAVYAASVLHGLSDIDALKDVRLMSGVSGGSAAIAYLVAYYDALVKQKDSLVWCDFLNRMCDPYIEDVIRGSIEMRIAGGERLGVLLRESFERRMLAQGKTSHGTLERLPVGVIFNTTLAGVSQWDAMNNRWDFASPECAGGILMFSNVKETELIRTGTKVQSFGWGMPIEVVSLPKVRLMSAAALSANFPPVFSNADVSIDQLEKFWVTDGGAAENRGIIALLLTLRRTLDDAVTANKRYSRDKLPVIHILVAEASAGSVDFSQDRGIGSKMGASDQFSSQLAKELLDDIRMKYTALGGQAEDVKYEVLEMPSVFRLRGGIGTHWMLPERVQLKDPFDRDYERAKPAKLSKATVKELIVDLHPAAGAPPRSWKPLYWEQVPLVDVNTWIQKDDHTKKWGRIRETLKR